MEITPTVRELPTGMKHSKRVQNHFANFTKRVEDENLHIGMKVTANRSITDSRNYVLASWMEPAVIVDVRNFDVLVKFEDGTVESSGSSGYGKESHLVDKVAVS